ncbi:MULTISPECIES: DUF4956 domain-containing protein [unclassified Aureispira]|uniref:DUF4956 domain-containing protein n=1 Tax=unclassified Aureispira TaxID=2649989 RepID=UPI0006961A78|nr:MULTISPECIES: DUF4956 domain-containing protein [unclassified Aureispira]WMX16079.1 DUF4956 domain-containing protein [Aureispira sp. CCB-E]
MNIEQLVENFNNSINIYAFLLNLIVATILSILLGQFYMRFGNAVANRKKFATNFIPLALTTVLIITIIKTSIALSLGLVGALSIVRFRAAIKDPEELIYLFLVIGIGLATGANYPILASIAVLFILVLLFINYKIQDRSRYSKENMLYVNIASETTNIDAFVSVLKEKMDYVELKRMDRMSTGVDITFICKASSLESITAMQEQIITSTPNTTVSIVDQPDLIV